MYQSGRAGDEAKKRKSPAKSIIHFTGVSCQRQDFRTVPSFIYYGYTVLFKLIKFTGNSIYEI